MPKIVATAKARGIQVSPLLAAYAAAIQRNQAGSHRLCNLLKPKEQLNEEFRLRTDPLAY